VSVSEPHFRRVAAAAAAAISAATLERGRHWASLDCLVAARRLARN